MTFFNRRPKRPLTAAAFAETAGLSVEVLAEISGQIVAGPPESAPHGYCRGRGLLALVVKRGRTASPWLTNDYYVFWRVPSHPMGSGFRSISEVEAARACAGDVAIHENHPAFVVQCRLLDTSAASSFVSAVNEAQTEWRREAAAHRARREPAD